MLAFVLTVLALLATPGAPLCPKTPTATSDEPTPHDQQLGSHVKSSEAADGLDFWSERAGRCYRYFPEALAWFRAEARCRDWGGHLTSIASDEENRLVGRISDCQDAWIGAFSTEFHKAADPATYEWTDSDATNGVPHRGGYTRLNASIQGGTDGGPGFDPHMGAVRAARLTWHNSYYHEDHPYVCEVAASREGTEECPAPFAHFRGNCYWLSNFESSFVSANLHCQRHMNAQLASVHSLAEARFIATLELDTDSCRMASVWLGLVRQDPCQSSDPGNAAMVKPFATEEGAAEVQPRSCFRWTDFSGEPDSVNPGWESGSPLTDDEKVNCASLSSSGFRSEMCHKRHRFICKRPVGVTDSQPLHAERQASNEAVAMETVGPLPQQFLFREVTEATPVEEPFQEKID